MSNRDNSSNGDDSSRRPPRATTETIRDFQYRALGYIIREPDGRVIAKDISFNTLGNFDGRKTIDSRGNPVLPGDVTQTLVIENARRRQR